MSGTRRGLWMTGALVVLAGLLVLGRIWQPYVTGGLREVPPADPGCDLHQGACAARLPGDGELRLEVLPHAIPLLQPLTFRVEVSGVVPVAMRVEVVGLNMDMGVTRVALRAVGPGRYTGEGVLPICSNRRMAWQARVLVQGPRAALVVPFRFVTQRG